MVTRFTVAFPALVLAACAFEPGGEGGVQPDAGTEPPIDGPGFDGDLAVDAAVIDAAVIDAAVIDAAVIDARPIDGPGPQCPGTYDVSAGDSKFRFVTNQQPLNNAVGDCANDGFGTHLATFENAADLDTVHAGRGDSEQFWVGAECNSLSPTECALTASWRWRGGVEPVTASLWADDEPNNPATEHVAISFRDSGNWRLNNVQRNEVHAYVCECGD